MSENENSLFGGSGVTLIVLILFFLTMGNGFGFGGNAAMQGALTRADVQDEIQNASIQNAITNGFANVNSAICATNQNMANTAANITLGMNTGFNSVNSNLQGMSESCYVLLR